MPECRPPAAEMADGEDMLEGERVELGESINFPIPGKGAKCKQKELNY